jgi:photoactive yellow protein
MRHTLMTITEVPLGLVELDDAGTILYYERDGSAPSSSCAPPPQEFLGRNFYTDVAPVADASEFRSTLAAFRRTHAPSHSFNFTFRYGNAETHTQVVVARVHEKSEGGGSRDSLLVRIRKA